MRLRPRFTIARMMVLVVVSGLAIAALRIASRPWASVIVTLTVLSLGVSILGVLTAQGKDRAFWVGFTVFGGFYVVLSSGPWFETAVRPRLLSSRVIELLHPHLDRRGARDHVYLDLDSYYLALWDSTPGQAAASPSSGLIRLSIALSAKVPEEFMRIGHGLTALLLAFLGAQIAKQFWLTRDIGDTSVPDHTSKISES
jgi:hypothetical protein